METFEIRSNARSLLIHNAFRHTGFVLFICIIYLCGNTYILQYKDIYSHMELIQIINLNSKIEDFFPPSKCRTIAFVLGMRN